MDYSSEEALWRLFEEALLIVYCLELGRCVHRDGVCLDQDRV